MQQASNYWFGPLVKLKLRQQSDPNGLYELRIKGKTEKKENA